VILNVASYFVLIMSAVYANEARKAKNNVARIVAVMAFVSQVIVAFHALGVWAWISNLV